MGLCCLGWKVDSTHNEWEAGWYGLTWGNGEIWLKVGADELDIEFNDEEDSEAGHDVKDNDDEDVNIFILVML